MAINKDIIEKTAQLANLHLSEDEKNEYSKQLSDILDYVETINEIDTSGIEATDYIEEIKNVFRLDEVQPSINREEIEKIAPDFEDGHIVVPQIIEN
jgi:aspartyl-tRNA(Asn)/glutamyl-tRNA(Gln) amidotransferase subunit C